MLSLEPTTAREDGDGASFGVAVWSLPEPFERNRPFPFRRGVDAPPVDGGVGLPSFVETASWPLDRDGVDVFEPRTKLNVRPPFSRIAGSGVDCGRDWSGGDCRFVSPGRNERG